MDEMKMQLSQLFENRLTHTKYSATNIFQNRKMIVYGAGNGFIAFHNAVLKRCNLSPALILDDKFGKGDTFNEVPAESVSSYNPSEEEKKNTVVVITIGNEETCKSIQQRLRNIGFENIIKSSDIFEFNLHHIPTELAEKGIEFYFQNRKDIETCLELMSDKPSQDVFLAMIRTYITQKPESIPSRPYYEQYFPADINLRKGYLRVVNCGAYDGDTVKRLNSQYGKVAALACFEPDVKNFNLLSSYLKENPETIAENIVAFPCGVYNTEAQLSFSSDKLLCSSIFDEGNAVIQCVALDDVIPNFKPTFISMDIEGAEMEALEGAVQLIRENKPDLAISVYHFPDHIWRIPLYLNRLGLGYKFYLRNYTGFTYETVLYATIG